MVDSTLKKYILTSFSNHMVLSDEQLGYWDKLIDEITDTQPLIEIMQCIAENLTWVDSYQYNRLIVPIISRLHTIDPDNGIAALFEELKATDAQSYLAAVLYESGVKGIIKRNKKEAQSLFEKGGNNGHIASLTGHASLLMRQSNEQNTQTIAELLKKPCEAAYPPALYAKAQFHANQKFSNFNAKTVRETLFQSAALGYPLAQYHYGRAALYPKQQYKCFGIAMPRDVRTSLSMLRRAAQQNCLPALYTLGICFKYGVKNGVIKTYEGDRVVMRDRIIYLDDKKARSYFEAAADRNHVKALCELGKIFRYGSGVQKDYKKATAYFYQALELDKKCTTAISCLSSMVSQKLIVTDVNLSPAQQARNIFQEYCSVKKEMSSDSDFSLLSFLWGDDSLKLSALKKQLVKLVAENQQDPALIALVKPGGDLSPMIDHQRRKQSEGQDPAPTNTRAMINALIGVKEETSGDEKKSLFGFRGCGLF
jgi:TPR repeat protein